jgi:small-conductance mechanosensitive channel
MQTDYVTEEIQNSSIFETLVKSSQEIEQIITPSQNILAAIITLILGLVIARVLGKLTKLILKELDVDKTLKKTGIRISTENLISAFVIYLTYFFTIFITLDQLGITKTFFNIIIVFFLIIILVSLIVSLKDLLPKLLAGRKLKQIIKEKEKISFNGMTGKIIKIGLTETKVETRPSEFLKVPNNYLLNSLK